MRAGGGGGGCGSVVRRERDGSSIGLPWSPRYMAGGGVGGGPPHYMLQSQGGGVQLKYADRFLSLSLGQDAGSSH